MRSERKEEMISTMYPAHKRQEDKAASPYIYWILRPLSLHLSIVLHRLGLTATPCTLLSAIVLLCGLVFMAWPGSIIQSEWLSFVFGALLVNAYLYLDVVDGNLARLAKTSSRFGEFFDSTLNVFAGFAVPLAVGVGIFVSDNKVMYQDLGLPSELFISAGVGVAILRLFRRIVNDNISRLSSGGRFSVLEGGQSFLKTAAAAINSATFPLLLVAVMFGVGGAWLMFFLLFNLVTLGYVIMMSHRRLAT